MSTKKQVGSKLASSVRQAKVQQKQQSKQKSVADKPSEPVERSTSLITSKRVWPD